MVHFCYLSIYLGIKIVFCRPVLQRMARMEMVHFCYLSIYLGIKIVFCHPVLQRMARMEIGPIETRKVGQILMLYL